jgi:hypothetical protein
VMRHLGSQGDRPSSEHVKSVASAELSYTAFTGKVRTLIEGAFN